MIIYYWHASWFEEVKCLRWKLIHRKLMWKEESFDSIKERERDDIEQAKRLQDSLWWPITWRSHCCCFLLMLSPSRSGVLRQLEVSMSLQGIYECMAWIVPCMNFWTETVEKYETLIPMITYRDDDDDAMVNLTT